MNSRKALATGILLAVFATLIGGGLLASKLLSPAQSDSKLKIVIDVSRRQSPKEIAKILESKGIVRSASDFFWAGKITRRWGRLKAGEYEVSPSMTPLELLSILTSGISVNHPITVREGENMYEIATDLGTKTLASAERFLELCKDTKFMLTLGFTAPLPPTLEGYLFPDTYFINRTMSPEDIVRSMVKHANAIWGPKEAERAKALGLTRHQVVTLASVIEKETGAPQERPMISSVFHNRLKKRMRLQSDPTTIYGIWEHYDGNIHRSDLLAKNDYNTYSVPALPIGAISNPGREAIQAALFPAESEFLFFVSHNDGTHEFTRTFGDHTAAVKKFQVDPKAREGKSWRDLKKTSATK